MKHQNAIRWLFEARSIHESLFVGELPIIRYPGAVGNAREARNKVCGVYEQVEAQLSLGFELNIFILDLT